MMNNWLLKHEYVNVCGQRCRRIKYPMDAALRSGKSVKTAEPYAGQMKYENLSTSGS